MADTDRLAQLKRRYHGSLSTKAGELEEKWRALAASEFSPSALSEMMLYVHQLAGSTAMYGYAQAAQLARDLEGHLRQPAPVDAAWQERVAACVSALAQTLARSL